MEEQIQSILNGGAAGKQSSSLESKIKGILNGDTPAQQTSSLPDLSSGGLPDIQKANSDIGDQSYNGWCQNFVEQATGIKTGQPTASAAWDSYAQKGQARPGLDGAQAGDMVYFAPDNSNDNAGHVGLLNDDGTFTSATYGGVKRVPLQEWVNQTGQQILGHVPVGGAN